jgi:cobalt/nickel transport system ATP-binding protein
MTCALSLRGLRYRYPDGTEALRGVDLDLAEGSCTALMGHNGAGKSTLAAVLAGFAVPQAGEILLFGDAVDPRRPEALRRAIGFTLVDPDDQLFMPTVLEDVCFGPRCAEEADARPRAEAMLAQLGIAHLAARPPARLSAGEKRLAALAGVLVMRPRILVLDEPSAFLDPEARTRVAAILSDLPQTRLVITHDAELVRELGATPVRMDRGALGAARPPGCGGDSPCSKSQADGA